MLLVFSHWISGWDKGCVKMKRSPTSHRFWIWFSCANLSLMSRLNILIYLFQVKADYLQRKKKKKQNPGASLVPVFRTPKQLLLLFVNRAARSDSQLTKEVPVQVDQNNNKAGVRSSNEERTDPNNGRAVAWQGMRSDSGASHSLFIAARSRVSYFFFLSGMSSKGSWHKNKQPVMAHPCDCQRRVRQSQRWRWLWSYCLVHTSRPGFTLTADCISFPAPVSSRCNRHEGQFTSFHLQFFSW